VTATNARNVLRVAALFLYVAGLAISLVLATISLRANAHLPWSWRPDDVSYTFIPWAMCMTSLVVTQLNTSTFSWPLLLQFAFAGVSLLFAFVNHALESRSLILGGIHLTVVLLCVAINGYTAMRSKDRMK